jgi:sigma-B regulation protein RsbU (phosphoserine phosphatase)
MTVTILDSLLVLLQLMCVIVVVTYLLTRSRFFLTVLEGHPKVRIQVLLVLIFGALSIYGSIGRVEVLDAITNVRDLGPMVAGLLGGPLVGLGAGLIGAAYRGTLGDFTIIPSMLATILAGFFGGLIWFANGRRFVGITIAVVFAIMMEGLHMLLLLAISHPFAAAVEVVAQVALPIILANAAGVFIFAFIITNRESEYHLQRERDALLREKERRDTRLAIAAEIQRSFLPDFIPQVEGFEIAARSVLAKEAGGDFFDVIPFTAVPPDTERTGILIADVSGKGIPAALFMALSRIVIRVNATWYRDQPALAIRDANNLIATDSRAGMFVTAFYGILDKTSRSLIYVNAGHNPPIVLRSNDGLFTELSATGIAMGVTENQEYQVGVCPLASGDIVVLYTDGVTQTTNSGEQMFGKGRLQDIISEARGASAEEILTRILDAVRLFTGNYPQSDDITLIVIRVV